VAIRFAQTCWICDKAINLENCKIVHAECYAAKLPHPESKSIGEKEERSWELCALVNKEQDPQKIPTLVKRMNQLLDEIEQLKHLGKMPCQAGSSPDGENRRRGVMWRYYDSNREDTCASLDVSTFPICSGERSLTISSAVVNISSSFAAFGSVAARAASIGRMLPNTDIWFYLPSPCSL